MIVALANPVSGQGRGRDRLRFVEQACTELGRDLKVIETSGPRDVVRGATEAAAERPEAVVLVGGDGSVGELARAYHDLAPDDRPPLILVPAGRGNSFYKAILSDAPWRDYVRRVLDSAYVRPIDGAQLVETGDVWMLGFSLGYFHDTVDAVRYFRGLRGRNLYTAAGAYAAARVRPFGVEVTVDGRAVYAGRSVLTAVGGGPFRGGRLLLFPTTDMSDGLLDLIVVEDVKAKRFAQILRQGTGGRHVEMDEVHAFRGAEVRIVSTDEIRAEMDGTLFPYEDDTLTLRSLPGLLPVAFPRWDWSDVAHPAGRSPAGDPS